MYSTIQGMNEEKQTEQTSGQFIEGSNPGGNESGSQPPTPKKKHLGFAVFLVTSSLLLLFTSVVPYLFVSTIPGAGILMLILFPIFIFSGVIAVLNYLIIIPFLIFKRPGLRLVASSVVVLLLSFPIAYYGATVVIDFHTAGQSARQDQEEDEREEREYRQKRAALSVIDVKQATDLLNNCDVVGFYTTDQAAPRDAEAVEASDTGIVVHYISPEDRFRMYAADRIKATIEPVAEGAQYICEGLEIGRDGVYGEE